MRKPIDPNRKITQVADPEFYRLSDPFFKYLLAKEEHADLCYDFTKAVVDHIPLAFRSSEARDFSSISYKNVELYRDNANEKAGFLDVAVITDTGVTFDIEVQTYKDKDLLAREFLYFSRLYGMQYGKGVSYGELKAVEIINVLDCNFSQEETPYHTHSEVWYPATNKVLTGLQILHFIEIPKFERMQEQKKQQGVAMSRLDRWLQYLTCSDPQEVLAFAKSDEIFGKVLEAEKMYINNKELMRKYYEENRDGYWEGVIANAKAEGIAIGEAKAKAEGIAEGIAIGEAKAKAEAKAEERKNLLAAARNLLAEGMDRIKVQQVTQLTDAEMASIC